MIDMLNDKDRLSDVLPYEFVKENQLILVNNDPVEIMSPNTITRDMYHEIQRFIGSSFNITKCTSAEFNDYITNTFSSESVANDISEELTDSFDLESFAGSISATEDLLSGNDDAPIIKLINGIISKAIKLRASDIHFEPYEDQIVIRYRVDGILKEVLTQDSKISSVLISRLKIMSGLDISERRLPQDGRVSLSLGDKNIDVRVSSLPSSHGERIVLRILDKQSAQINIDDLGLPEKFY